MSSCGFETMYSAQVPFVMLERTETLVPIRDFSSLSQMIPDPQNPIIGKFSLRMPQLPVQKFRSEGLIGAYFIFTNNWPLFLTGKGQVVNTGLLPYFWICMTFILYYYLKFNKSCLMKVNKIQLVLALCLISFTLSLQIEEDLPKMKQQFNDDEVTSHQVQEKISFKMECSPQASIVGKLYEECHIHDPYINIETIQDQKYQSTQTGRYLFSKKREQLYIVNHTHFIAIFFGKDAKKEPQYHNFRNDCKKAMVFEPAEQAIFVFSCQAIYKITFSHDNFAIEEVKANSEQREILSSQRFDDLIILLTGSNETLLYSVDVQLQLQSIASIIQDENSTSIIDSSYQDNQLILLTKERGLLYYKRSSNTFTLVDSLSFELEQQLIYRSLSKWRDTIFVHIQAQTQSFVAQLQTIKNKIHLVRYYKGYDEIFSIQVAQNLLLIHSNTKIDAFPINRDPRTIKYLFNGYSYLHQQSLLQFKHLQQDKFLIVRPQSISIAQWSLVGRKIQCQFNTGSYTLMLQTPCNPINQQAFPTSCSKIRRADISVYHKDSYLWLLMICGGIFIAIVLYLIYWRQYKMMRITLILKKIKEFKLKKKEIEFQEVNLGTQQDAPKSKQAKQKQQEGLDPYDEYVNSQRNNLN